MSLPCRRVLSLLLRILARLALSKVEQPLVTGEKKASDDRMGNTTNCIIYRLATSTATLLTAKRTSSGLEGIPPDRIPLNA